MLWFSNQLTFTTQETILAFLYNTNLSGYSKTLQTKKVDITQ